ncbi:MAG: hypothetical protein U1E28_09765 [Beijerinckiaceae bacterium]
MKAGDRRERNAGSYDGRPRLPAAAFACLALLAVEATPAHAQSARRTDVQSDSQDALTDAMYATPNPYKTAPLDNLYATAPGLEQQIARPQVRLNALVPYGWNSNADEVRYNGLRTMEWRPNGSVSVATPLGETWVRATVSAFAETDRFARSWELNRDKAGGSFRLQVVNPGDDQFFSPFFSFAPRWDFQPTFDTRLSIRQDYNVGLNKRINFDGDLRPIGPAGDTSAATFLSFGLTAFVQRRERWPQTSSNALFVIPSASLSFTRNLSATLSLEYIARWFDRNKDGFRARESEIQPIATISFVIPSEWLGGERIAEILGHPTLNLQGSYLKAWSNVPDGGFAQWKGVSALRFGWTF